MAGAGSPGRGARGRDPRTARRSLVRGARRGRRLRPAGDRAGVRAAPSRRPLQGGRGPGAGERHLGPLGGPLLLLPGRGGRRGRGRRAGPPGQLARGWDPRSPGGRRWRRRHRRERRDAAERTDRQSPGRRRAGLSPRARPICGRADPRALHTHLRPVTASPAPHSRGPSEGAPSPSLPCGRAPPDCVSRTDPAGTATAARPRASPGTARAAAPRRAGLGAGEEEPGALAEVAASKSWAAPAPLVSRPTVECRGQSAGGRRGRGAGVRRPRAPPRVFHWPKVKSIRGGEQVGRPDGAAIAGDPARWRENALRWWERNRGHLAVRTPHCGIAVKAGKTGAGSVEQ